VTGRDGGVPATGRVAGAVGQDSGWERSGNGTCIAQSLPAVCQQPLCRFNDFRRNLHSKPS